jgi:hypothetical protein
VTLSVAFCLRSFDLTATVKFFNIHPKEMRLMQTTAESGISTDRLKEISDLAKRAGDEAVHLRIVERFISEVERRLLKTVPTIFDIQRVRTALDILKTLSEEDDIDECLEAEFRLDQEFHLWKELIIERDQKIETYHFRRLCDSAPYPLEDEVFIALASFYRGVDLTPATQSKFDLSVTRLFTRPVSGGRREMKGVRSDIAKQVNRLFPQREGETVSVDEVDSAVLTIEGFTNEALDYEVFEDLVKANIFDRYRAFKREIGSLFFQPEIVAAAIECNIAVGNVFDTLLRSADEQLSSRLTVDVDLASALHDPSPETRLHINELFRVFFGDNEPSDHAISGDVDYLGKLLSRSASSKPAVDKHPDEQPQIESTSAQGRLAGFLRTLTEARPDTELLLKQMRRSESLRTFDINDFLYSSDGSPDVVCRRALGLILWSLEFRENDLKQSKELTETIQREATSLLYKAEHLAAKQQHEIEVSDELNESRLRGVLNALLDSRLRLERSIVRFTNRKIAEVSESTQKVADHSSAAKSNGGLAAVFSRWLIITLVFVAAVAGIFYFMQQEFGGLVGNNSALSELDIRTLPQHEFMKSAYRHEKTIFITVHDSWSQRSADERKQTISEILEKSGFRFQTVVVMSESGAILENVSREGMYLDNGLSQASTVKAQ